MIDVPTASTRLAEALTEMLNKTEGPRLLPLPAHMEERVLAVHQAINDLVVAQIRTLSGWRPPND